MFGIEANNFILVLGATATIVSAWGAFFAPKESWLIYATTLNRLRALQAKIKFMKKSTDEKLRDPNSIKILFDDYQRVLDEHNSAWAELRAAHNKSLNSDAKKTGAG